MRILAGNKKVYTAPVIDLSLYEEFDCILTGSIDSEDIVAPGFDNEDWVG